jgi:DNA (cytosine-5)-methyltransferase 1
MPITFADLFAGIGGFRLGIENAAKKLGIPVECVFSSEIEKNARFIYEKNFHTTPHGDITKIQATDIPDHDILCGGFPCQDVSTAGKREGLKGKRTGLFFDIIRVLQEKQPSIVFLENVKGLFSSNGGWDFAKVLIELEDAGYEVEWYLLNSKDHGVPQKRERVFIIGHLATHRRCRSKIFPIREVPGFCTEPAQSEKEICSYAGTLTKRQYESWNGNFVRYRCFTERRSEEAKQIRHEHMKNGKDWCPRRGKEIVLRDDELCNGLTKTIGKEHIISNGEIVRELTPIECERLQGFPDNWTEGISINKRRECLGNAVTVNVIEAIAEKLLTGMIQNA